MIQGEELCNGCKSIVIDAEHCPKFNTPCHQSCAGRVRPLGNGAFAKCCATRSESPTLTDSTVGPTTQDSVRIINKALAGFKPQLEVSHSVGNLKAKFDSLSIEIKNAIVRIELNLWKEPYTFYKPIALVLA